MEGKIQLKRYDLERVVLTALRQNPASAMAQSVVVHRLDEGDDWTIGPVGYAGEVPPEDIETTLRMLRQKYALRRPLPK